MWDDREIRTYLDAFGRRFQFRLSAAMQAREESAQAFDPLA